METLQQKLQTTTPFFQAFLHKDESQGLLLIAWYAEERQRRVQGMSFLIDYNPPWEGAIKDVMLLPVCSPQRLHREYIASWAQRSMSLEEIDAVEALQELLQGLEANGAEGIRLPRDLIRARDVFLASILPLLDLSSIPSFTVEDFDALSRLEQTAESLQHIEETVGRRVRLDNGEEIVVLTAPFDDEEDWFDDEEDWFDDEEEELYDEEGDWHDSSLSSSSEHLPGIQSQRNPSTQEIAGHPGKEFRIRQICPESLSTWASTEWFYWPQQVNAILKREGWLFSAAYDSVDWESY